jgi:hypothetical protein
MALTGTILSSLAGVVTEKAAGAFAELRKELREHSVRIVTDDSRGCLIEHVRALDNWSQNIRLSILPREKRLSTSFVDLALDVGLSRYEKVGRSQTTKIKNIYQTGGHVALLGRPGAGKTTSLQKIAQRAVHDWETRGTGVPLIVRLRDLESEQTLSSFLLNQLGIIVSGGPTGRASRRKAWELRTLQRHLNTISAVLLIDGLDELNPGSRAEVEKEIESLSVHEGQYRIILTCRTADYERMFTNIQPYTILPLSDPQIALFARRWLGKDRSPNFLKAIRANPYGGTEVVPLTLAHFCAIYERDGELPLRPFDVYEMIVSLAVEDWDRERGVARRSRYSDFSARKRERFLQALAYTLTLSGRRGSFLHQELEGAYESISDLFGLPTNECRAVVREVESHTGLIQQAGVGRYEFVHLVIQEYLTAMHAGRMSNVVRHLVPPYPNEMALVVANSVSPDELLEEVLLYVLQPGRADLSISFFITFLERLAIERPRFRPSARLGWVFMGLLSVVTEPLLSDTLSFTRPFPSAFTRFFAAAEVQQSFRLAAAEADVSQHGSARRIMPRAHTSVPPELTKQWKLRTGAGFVVPAMVSSVFRSPKTR